MRADVRTTLRLGTADFLADVSDDTYDLVLFCEIIEHLAFNPVRLWSEVYRTMRPGGSIIVTTPNSFHYPNALKRIEMINSGNGIGVSVDEIFSAGTYGHHWKEFTLVELQRYFQTISADFDVTRYKYIYDEGEKHLNVPSQLLKAAETTDVLAYNIYLDVKLREKRVGIQARAPWEIM